MGENKSIAVILNELANDLDYIEQTLEEIKSTDSKLEKANSAIEQKASELHVLHLPGNDIESFKNDAIKQLTSASKVFRPSAGTKRELAQLDSEVELVLSQARTIFNAVQKAEDEKHIRHLIEAYHITDEAAFLRRKISHIRGIIQENSREFMWCSFENNAPPPTPTEQILYDEEFIDSDSGSDSDNEVDNLSPDAPRYMSSQIARCLPYNVLRRHVELPLSVVRVPCSFSSPPADNGSLPPTITDSHNILTFNYNAKKTLLVVLRQCGDQRNIEIYKKTGDTYAVCSTLVPRTFEPVYVCFGPVNYLLVVDGSLPRIVVFQIEPDGIVWQCVRTLILPETLGHVSVCVVVDEKMLWIGTSDGKWFVSEKTLASLLPELYIIQPNQGLPPGNYKCGVPDCETCKVMEDGARSFVQVTRSTGESFPINDRLTCLSNNVVYLITCTSHKVQYVGITEKSFDERMRQHSITRSQKTAVGKHFSGDEHPDVQLCLQNAEEKEDEAKEKEQKATDFKNMAKKERQNAKVLKDQAKTYQQNNKEFKEQAKHCQQEATELKEQAETLQQKAKETQQKDTKVNVIAYVPNASLIKMIESMWIQKLKTKKPTGLNGILSLSPDSISDDTRDILRREASKNYHVQAGYLDEQYEEYCPSD